MKLKNLLKEYDYTRDVKGVASQLKYELKRVQKEYNTDKHIMFFNDNWQTLGADFYNGVEPDRAGIIGGFFSYLNDYYKKDKAQYKSIIDNIQKYGIHIKPASHLGYWEITVK